MKKRLRLSISAAFGVITISGLTLAIVRHWLPEIPGTRLHHPAETLLLKGHVFSGPWFVFIMGITYAIHAWPYIRNHKGNGRRTGLLLVATLPILVLSGYLIQLLTGSAALDVAIWGHILTGCLVVGIFWLHFLKTTGRRRWIYFIAYSVLLISFIASFLLTRPADLADELFPEEIELNPEKKNIP